MKKILFILPLLLMSCSEEGNYSDVTKQVFSYTIASVKINSFNNNETNVCIDKSRDLVISNTITSEGKLGEDPDKIIKNSYLEVSNTKFYFKNTSSGKEITLENKAIKKIKYNEIQKYTDSISMKDIPEDGTYKVTIEVSLKEFNGDGFSTSSDNIIDHTFSEDVKIGSCN